MDKIELTAENYHSIESQRDYLSASRYKDFCGSLGVPGCEAKALAKMKGEWIEEPTSAMLMSSYVDQHFAGRLDIFKAHHPEIFTQKMELKSQYQHAEKIIQRIERDPYFMRFMSGEKQVIMTAELFGATWSCMVDSLIYDAAIVDLKVMSCLNKAHYVKDWGVMSFVQYYGYIEQAAIYQRIVESNIGKKLPFYIAAASKEDEPDIEIIGFTQSDLDNIWGIIEGNIQRIKEIREGLLFPDSCGVCDYCRSKKVLIEPIHYSKLILNINS